jgi:hypothetical protein
MPLYTPRRRAPLVVGAVVVLLLILAGAALFLKRYEIQRWVQRSQLPEPVPYREISPSPLPTTTPPTARSSPLSTTAALPAEMNLAIPFTPQAPHANWDPPYKEFCEEASVLMAMSFLQGEAIPNPETADRKMLAIKTFEDKRFGYYEDTTAEETATIIREHYKYPQVRLLTNPTVHDIKRAVAGGHPVIVPAAGRLLGNPYFQQPGPIYHMLVIKGYTNKGQFIVNDPGTRRGADFLYSEATIMNAIHDWPGNDQIERGRKVILIVGENN